MRRTLHASATAHCPRNPLTAFAFPQIRTCCFLWPLRFRREAPRCAAEELSLSLSSPFHRDSVASLHLSQTHVLSSPQEQAWRLRMSDRRMRQLVRQLLLDRRCSSSRKFEGTAKIYYRNYFQTNLLRSQGHSLPSVRRIVVTVETSVGRLVVVRRSRQWLVVLWRGSRNSIGSRFPFGALTVAAGSASATRPAIIVVVGVAALAGSLDPRSTWTAHEALFVGRVVAAAVAEAPSMTPAVPAFSADVALIGAVGFGRTGSQQRR
mmetsp:Transcript_1170/g.2532  ORF Transcript_1170/g.2532 Transcript_1170/m.2532 type:complete len:264 (+) Transcript_1170:2690-3481(+)